MGAAVAIALIATSLTVLLQTPSEDIVEDPLLPVLVPEEPQITQPDVTTETPVTDAPEAVRTVEITEAEIVGKTNAQVAEVLTQKGLRLDGITGNIAPSPDLVGTAYRVNPQGTVASNTLIAVYFYAAIPQPPKPRDLVVTPASGSLRATAGNPAGMAWIRPMSFWVCPRELHTASGGRNHSGW